MFVPLKCRARVLCNIGLSLTSSVNTVGYVLLLSNDLQLCSCSAAWTLGAGPSVRVQLVQAAAGQQRRIALQPPAPGPPLHLVMSAPIGSQSCSGMAGCAGFGWVCRVYEDKLDMGGCAGSRQRWRAGIVSAGRRGSGRPPARPSRPLPGHLPTPGGRDVGGPRHLDTTCTDEDFQLSIFI